MTKMSCDTETSQRSFHISLHINLSRSHCALRWEWNSALFSLRTVLRYHPFFGKSSSFCIFFIFLHILITVNAVDVFTENRTCRPQNNPGGINYDNSEMFCHKMYVQWKWTLFQREYWDRRWKCPPCRWDKLQKFPWPEFLWFCHEQRSASLRLWKNQHRLQGTGMHLQWLLQMYCLCDQGFRMSCQRM